MFLSKVIAQGGEIHCNVEGVVLSVEEPTELRGGKISENAARSERHSKAGMQQLRQRSCSVKHRLVM